MVGEIVDSATRPGTRTDTMKFIDNIVVDVDNSQPEWDSY